jgi:transposase
MARHRLTDEHWECIASVFPPPAKTGRPRANPRQMMDAILWILRTGAPWRDLPEAEFGPWETVYTWFDQWTSDGTLDEILDRLKAAMTDTKTFDHELWCIDGTIVRAHRCAAGGGKKKTRASRRITPSADLVAVSRRKSTWSATVKATRCTPK